MEAVEIGWVLESKRVWGKCLLSKLSAAGSSRSLNLLEFQFHSLKTVIITIIHIHNTIITIICMNITNAKLKTQSVNELLAILFCSAVVFFEIERSKFQSNMIEITPIDNVLIA